MSAGSIAGLVLGSSVLGALLGGYLGGRTERETSFRERLIQASVDFLGSVANARNALSHTRRGMDRALASASDGGGASGEMSTATRLEAEHALDELDDAISSLWATIPLLLVVFPTAGVANAGRALTEALDSSRQRLAHAYATGQPVNFGREYERLDRLHLAYAEIARQDIRRGAFRSRSAQVRRHRASPIPPVRYRLRGPGILTSVRWERTSR